MNHLEEHNYGVIRDIKSEKVERNPLQISELNIKMEYQSRNDDENSVNNVNSVFIEEEFQDIEPQRNNTAQDKDNLKAETTEESDSDSESSILSNLSLSDMKKACVLQTCLGLLDSSSSDDDELMLLWLMYRNRKKKLRKRRRLC